MSFRRIVSTSYSFLTKVCQLKIIAHLVVADAFTIVVTSNNERATGFPINTYVSNGTSGSKGNFPGPKLAFANCD